MDAPHHQKPISFAEDVELLTLDDEGFIYSAEMESLVGLNRTAMFIWRACAADMTLSEVIAHTAKELDLPGETAETFVKLAVVEWEKHGLLKKSLRGHRTRPPREDRLFEIEPLESPGLPATLSIFETRRYAVLDTTFTITCQTAAQAERLCAVAGHLEITAEAMRDSAPETITINIVGGDETQEIFAGGQLVKRCNSLDELAPLIHWLVFSSAIAADNLSLNFHTAAVAREGFALLLPGSSGVGKSTLSWMLQDEGFGYMSDDTVVLDQDSFLVRGLPFSICVKESGLAMLDSETTATSLHLRADGLRVHYHHPAPGNLIVESKAAKWMVFPRYTPGETGNLSAITSAEALRRLLEQSISPRHLSRDTAARLMAWAADLQCCELNFPNTRFAVAAILGFCNQHQELP